MKSSEFIDFVSDFLAHNELSDVELEDLVGIIQNKRGSIYDHPITNVKWVDTDEVVANDYNPNAVASKEMKLLELSILKDGYTQPVVTIYDDELSKYVIIDGFHRTMVAKTSEKVREITGGRVPIVVLKKDINDRMASTVRHNRARGTHSVDGMGNIVFEMLKNGLDDAEICNEMGMESEELVRLKHLTGFSKLFENTEYGKEWLNKRQLELKKLYIESEKDEDGNIKKK